MNKIVLDFGGVLVEGSRSYKIVELLGLSKKERSSFIGVMSDPIVKQVAIGESDMSNLYCLIQKKIPTISLSALERAFYLASKVDEDVKFFLSELKLKYKVVLISNSLPPYSDFIEENLASYFQKLYLSDRLGHRKPKDMYDYILKQEPSFFEHSLVIDDRAENLKVPEMLGAEIYLYDRFDSMVKLLHQHKGVVG